jgi:hypothetical protein
MMHAEYEMTQASVPRHLSVTAMSQEWLESGFNGFNERVD